MARTKHQGDYRKIVEGVNQTLDAVIGPLNVAADYVDRISKGDIPPKITDSYNGDFNEIKNNLNNCIDNITALVNDAGLLVKAAVEGKLATRADATKHHRLSGYLYALTRNAAYAKKAWSGGRIPRVAGVQVKGADVVTPIEDVMALSTNSVAQGCLEAIEVLEMCGGRMG